MVRRANVEHVRRCLEIAPALGTYVVATETGTMSASGEWTDTPRNSSEEAWGLLYDALEALLPVAEERGVILALETYVGHVLKTQGQLSRAPRSLPDAASAGRLRPLQLPLERRSSLTRSA